MSEEKMKYTPGPWTAYFAGDEGDIYIGTSGALGLTMDETIAARVSAINVPIITAAPRLLEALVYLLAKVKEAAGKDLRINGLSCDDEIGQAEIAIGQAGEKES